MRRWTREPGVVYLDDDRLVVDHAPVPGPGHWDWRCLRCDRACSQHAGPWRRWRWRRDRIRRERALELLLRENEDG